MPEKEQGEDPVIEKDLESTERRRLFRDKFKQLGEDCQRVLKMFLEGISMVKIAEKMGYASEGYAKKRKFKCKQKLTSLIKADVRFQELTEG